MVTRQNVTVFETAADEPLPPSSPLGVDEISNTSTITKKRKKKDSSKKRSSSKIGLIRDEDGDPDDASLSSAYSHTSLPSAVGEEEERYLQMQNERVLKNFQAVALASTPTPSHRDSKSRPLPLLEESAYENVKVESTRLESAASRPRSPSPKQSQRISFVNQQNDYVMRVAQKDKRASNSSLSTIALQDHDESGKLVLVNNPTLPPHREESFESKQSSKNSTVLTASSAKRLLEVSSKSSGIVADDVDGNFEEGLTGEQDVTRVESPVFSLSPRHNSNRSPRASEVSEISLSNGKVAKERNRSVPRSSVSSELTNITLASEKMGTETRLTEPIPVDHGDGDDENDENMHGDLLLEDPSDTATLMFEDEFMTTDNGKNVDFIQQSVLASEERQQRSSKSPPSLKMVDDDEKRAVLPSGVLSDADSQKLASYVEAFKRRRPSDQYSFGSESAESENGVPLATLQDQDSDSYELSDTLKRVKKLSDAFPAASLEQERMKKRSAPNQKSKHESLAELSVVEYNNSRKKKLKKKRPGSSSPATTSSNANSNAHLPPLRGRRPLAGVLEEGNPSDTDA